MASVSNGTCEAYERPNNSPPYRSERGNHGADYAADNGNCENDVQHVKERRPNVHQGDKGKNTNNRPPGHDERLCDPRATPKLGGNAHANLTDPLSGAPRI
jgi:hypothetical protein